MEVKVVDWSSLEGSVVVSVRCMGTYLEKVV